MAVRSTMNFPGLKTTLLNKVTAAMSGSWYSSLKLCPTGLGSHGVRFAYQPKSKFKRNVIEVPGYRIGVTKAWDSWHTGSLAGSSDASERFMDDIMIRKFIEGVFYELLVSDTVIKRRANQIIVAFYLAGSQAAIKTYFLVGFSERLLSEMFGCIVKLEIISHLVKSNSSTS